MFKKHFVLSGLFLVSTAFASVAFAAQNAAIMKSAEAAKPAVVALTETLVGMPSGTDNYPELKAKHDMLEKILVKMGAKVEYFDAPAPREGTRNLVATWKGKGKGKVMFMGHIDTVWNPEQTAKKPFKIDGDKAHGAGVGDMQISVATLIYAADTIVNQLKWQNKFDTLTVLLNCDEEKGSFGSRDLIRKLAAEQDAVFSFEGGGAKGTSITSSARGTGYYRMHIEGVESHSGAAPEKGRNAGYEMAHQMLQMRDLGDKKKGTDVNWTLGNFGTKANVIPGKAWAEANIRISTADEFERIEKDMSERIKNKLIPETKITMDFRRGRVPFAKNAATDALAAHYVALAKNELGVQITSGPAGGGVDSCYAFEGAPTLEGMGPGGGGGHSDNEFALLNTIAPRIYMAVRMTEDVLNKKIALPAKK